MDDDRVRQLFEDDRALLPIGEEVHFHIVVTSSDEDFEFARIITSPPYRDRPHAAHEINDSRFDAAFRPYKVNILECRHTCPHSSLGSFGWQDDEPVPFRWWSPGGPGSEKDRRG